MINFPDIWIVFAGLCLMLGALIADWLRPGFVLFSGVVFFMCTGILSPQEALAGFANEGMITVGLLFLISEGVRRSDALGHLVKWLLPAQRGMSVRKGYLRILPSIVSVSAFLNNTPVVVVFIPIIKQWARKSGLAVRKFLIPLSYAAILGGMCTLIGTSTNLVVHGMMLDAGFEGFTMFELGKVGGCIALVGGLYLIFFGDKRLPGDTPNEETARNEEPTHLVEAVLGPRFPGINHPFGEFDFKSHYGAEIRAVRRNGVEIEELDKAVFRAGDTLVLDTDGSFIETWGESRVFLMLSNGSEHRPACPRWKKWLALGLLVIMIAGATFGSMPFMADLIPGRTLDMFFWVCIVAVLMACFGIFPAKKYTKFISWDILITIASALAISRAMVNSGLADWIAAGLTGLSGVASPWIVLAVLYITTNLITEFITNNAAAAFAFPVALSAAAQLGMDPMPFFVAICIAASCSFSSPIGYQTNMIVQGIGNYRFRDFVRIGLPLNIIAFVVSMTLIPLFWPFEAVAA
ncbi:SLC13 family permease [uncultured Alistipes sp.]|uniref:SLC13 family permease n=1 Tax=uncultured Alistipes sp. TaxID=538949 RepID=UPI00320AF3B6